MGRPKLLAVTSSYKYLVFGFSQLKIKSKTLQMGNAKEQDFLCPENTVCLLAS